jgi:hypothetical protein
MNPSVFDNVVSACKILEISSKCYNDSELTNNAILHIELCTTQTRVHYVRFEVFTLVTLKNGAFWDVMPRGSCKNRRFGGT